jgi:Domain of unknown function (DUF4157)
MAAFDLGHRNVQADADVEFSPPATGKATLAQDLGTDSSAESASGSDVGGGSEEVAFDFTALSGDFSEGSRPEIAAAMAEQESDDVSPGADEIFGEATAGPSAELPHKAQMEQAFGRSFDDVSAFLGADGPLRAMDANAAAKGRKVAFASTAPTAKEVAHELTHVEQDRKHGGGEAIMASGAISEVGSASEREAEGVSEQVAGGGRAPTIVAAPDGGIQRSFLSFAVKAGAKKVSKGMLKNFIKTRIKDKIVKLVNKKIVKEILEDAATIEGILNDPWWVTAIGFVPVVGDAFDLVHVPMQIRDAIRAADRLESKVHAAVEAEQKAFRAANAAKKTVTWTAHGGKHVASIKMAWKDVVLSTKNGPAKYLHGTNIEALERSVWAGGRKVTNGKSWKVQEFPNVIGASEGKASRWMRVEESAGTIHGHPISEAEFLKLTR